MACCVSALPASRHARIIGQISLGRCSQRGTPRSLSHCARLRALIRRRRQSRHTCASVPSYFCVKRATQVGAVCCSCSLPSHTPFTAPPWTKTRRFSATSRTPALHANHRPGLVIRLSLRIAHGPARFHKGVPVATASALPPPNRPPGCLSCFTTSTEQEGSQGSRPCFIYQVHATPFPLLWPAGSGLWPLLAVSSIITLPCPLFSSSVAPSFTPCDSHVLMGVASVRVYRQRRDAAHGWLFGPFPCPLTPNAARALFLAHSSCAPGTRALSAHQCIVEEPRHPRLK